MKKSLSAVLVVAALSAPWATHAQESYVKFGVGQGRYKMDGQDADKTGVSIALVSRWPKTGVTRSAT